LSKVCSSTGKLSIIMALVTVLASGCAARNKSQSTDIDELLGKSVVEGKVIEGTIDSTTSGAVIPGAVGLEYRVQVVASTVREEAEGVVGVLRGMIPDSVYIDYIDPYYKVRVGDFSTRTEAEGMRNKIVGLGYEDAWIVEVPKQSGRDRK